MIKAECYSDDHAVKIEFDATAYFESASDTEILALAGCGWGGDYPADAVADHFSGGATASLYSYLDVRNRTGRDTIGFECHVDEESAMTWLRVNRPTLAAMIEATDQHDAPMTCPKCGITAPPNDGIRCPACHAPYQETGFGDYEPPL